MPSQLARGTPAARPCTSTELSYPKRGRICSSGLLEGLHVWGSSSSGRREHQNPPKHGFKVCQQPADEVQRVGVVRYPPAPQREQAEASPAFTTPAPCRNPSAASPGHWALITGPANELGWARSALNPRVNASRELRAPGAPESGAPGADPLPSQDCWLIPRRFVLLRCLFQCLEEA